MSAQRDEDTDPRMITIERRVAIVEQDRLNDRHVLERIAASLAGVHQELVRIKAPGCPSCIHCKDVP